MTNHTFAVHSVNTEKREVKPQRLKFYPHFTHNFYTLQYTSKLMEFAKQAMSFWEETLTVKNPGNEKQLSKRYCDNNYYYTAPNNTIFCRGSRCKRSVLCGPAQIPNDYLSECFEEYNNRLYKYYHNGSGIPFAGYVLLIDAVSTSTCSGSTAAYAGSCLMDPKTDRPILGYVNVCPGKMKVAYPEDRNSIGIFIHEIGHALGFAASSFAFMRDTKGNPRTPRDSKGKPTHQDQFGMYLPSQNTIKKITRPWRSTEGWFTKDFHAFVTPKILEAAKRHFNCRNLDGADLENKYQTSSIGSHWEGRAYGGEIMAGRIEVDYAVSSITLSFFDDSGWYIVNYKKAMNWEYGRKAGCTFVTRSCFEYAENRRRQGVNRYFQTYGSNSICIEHRNVWTYTDRYMYTLSDYLKGSCHRYKCHGSKAISLYFKSATVNCTKSSQPVPFNVTDGGKTLKGEIICPNIKRFCKDKKP
ncbi:hypothetical protein MN116_006487 [Schistosoma mekongi]|uniref:Leishmanolysin-like peptidase n=1 Tax=Schistosoma mekongi TaxID=38744 RepID=A0AAE1ZCE9_SCHME|nr:hypothetical protein MN116_006487 [Schistosoma mekongi]